MERNDDHRTDDNGACRGCICAVQAALEYDIQDGGKDFDRGFGDLLDDMHNALAAIHRVRRERFTNKHDEIANSWEAATKLVQIATAVHRTIQRGQELTTPWGNE